MSPIINWPEGLIPDPVDELIPLSSVELKIAKGTYSISDTEAKYPCGRCGFSLKSLTSRPGACSFADHNSQLTICLYCKKHDLLPSRSKIKGSECTCCGPTEIRSRNGKYPRRVSISRKKRGRIDNFVGSKTIRFDDGDEYLTSELVYDLDEPLEGYSANLDNA